MADDPSNAELHRLLVRVGQDVQGLIARMQEYVPREVYQAEKAALSGRVQRLEDESVAARERADAESSASHQGVRMAKLSAIASFIAAVGSGVATGWLSSKGGH